jgi:23S rRNA (guanosine2251-2'-O)-methyltransferase
MLYFAPMAFYQKQNPKPIDTTQLLYGQHAVLEALMAGKDINKVMVQTGAKSELLNDILKKCKQQAIPIQYVPKEKFLFLQQKNHQGIMAYISPIAFQNIEDLIPQLFEEGKTPFILILDRITDVRNLGAIARSAHCAGVHAIVIPATESAPINEDAVKTSAGALMHIPICREKNFKTVMEILNQSGILTIACSEKGKKNFHELDLTVPVAIIMGNEETGISPDILKKCQEMAKIPLDFGVQSLNVSVAAGIAVYETVRQRIFYK